jgi:hypothetical protein
VSRVINVAGDELDPGAARAADTYDIPGAWRLCQLRNSVTLGMITVLPLWPSESRSRWPPTDAVLVVRLQPGCLDEQTGLSSASRSGGDEVSVESVA